MKDKKRLALRFFLAAELVVVTFFYLFSSGGLQALRREDAINRELLADIGRLEAEIVCFQKSLKSAKILTIRKVLLVKSFKWHMTLKQSIYFPKKDNMYKLPPLGYAYDALEPYIDARTMEIHYTKHHQGYIDNLNCP